MANISQVRYEQPNPQAPWYLQALAGAAKGFAGQAVMNQNKQAEAEANKMKLAQLLLPAYAQQNRDITSVAPGTAGSIPYGNNAAYSVGAAPTNWSSMENMVDFKKKQNELDFPEKAFGNKAAETALAQAAQVAMFESDSAKRAAKMASALAATQGIRDYFSGKKSSSAPQPKVKKPAHIPDAVWNSATEQQQADFVSKYGS
jgi:hypothetical protein